MALNRWSKRLLLQTAVGRVLLIPFRFVLALSYYTPKLKRILAWTLHSRETTNFTYDLTPGNLQYLAHTIAAVTGAPYDVVAAHLREIQNDHDLRRHIVTRVRMGPKRGASDATCGFGRRAGWYAMVRILKPRLVVETGVDKGLGSVVLCAALLRNRAEGFAGEYIGTEINPEAGFLLAEPYSHAGRVVYGDSIETLQGLSGIDLFINDSDHSAQYERREYETIARKLTPGAVILGDNCHCNCVLADFSHERGRQFVFFREEPRDHWYPGGGIGFSFPREPKSLRIPLPSPAIASEILPTAGTVEDPTALRPRPAPVEVLR